MPILWGVNIFMDIKVTLDKTHDLDHKRVWDILPSGPKALGVALLTHDFDPGALKFIGMIHSP